MFIGRLIGISEETKEGLEMRQGKLQEKKWRRGSPRLAKSVPEAV